MAPLWSPTSGNPKEKRDKGCQLNYPPWWDKTSADPTLRAHRSTLKLRLKPLRDKVHQVQVVTTVLFMFIIQPRKDRTLGRSSVQSGLQIRPQ